jgi:hypothetical protein
MSAKEDDAEDERYKNCKLCDDGCTRHDISPVKVQQRTPMLLRALG